MSIGTNDAIIKKGTPKTLEANGASIANNAMGAADDATYSVASDGSGAPDGCFIFSGAFGTAPTENTTLDIYAAEQDISSTNDEQTPEASAYRWKWLASLPVNNVTTTQYIKSRVVRGVPDLMYCYIYNNGCGQTLSAGWTLTFEPRTLGPSA